MKLKNLLILLFVVYTSCLHVNAYERWDIKAKNSFKKAEVVYVSVSFCDANVFDLPIDDFIETSNQSVNQRDDGNLLLQRFTNRFIKKLKQYHIEGLKRELLTNGTTGDYELRVFLNSITESGGLEGTAYLIETSSNKAKEIPLSISDGRWNSSSKLLLESAETLATIIANKLAYFKGMNVKPFDW